jgi:hypothetical protein
MAKPSLHYYTDQVYGKTCRWCDHKVQLHPRDVKAYAHDGGYEIEGFQHRQWIYVVCSKCDYAWSLSKLGIREARF